MNAKQTNLLNMSLAVEPVLAAIGAQGAAPALVTGHERLLAKIDEIKAQAALQALPVTGKTVDRNQVFATAIDATLIVARLVLSHARAQKLGDLAAQVTVYPSTFRALRLAHRVPLMQQVHDAAESVLPQIAPLGVTEAMIADLQTKINAAAAIHSLPRSTVVARRVATENLAERFRELVDLLENDLDPLVELLRDTNADGWSAYHAARLVIDRPGTADKPEAPAPATAVASEKLAA